MLLTAAPVIPGLLSIHPNQHVESIKTLPWCLLLDKMGKGGDGIMMNLLLDCGIFMSVGSGHGNFSQLSGKVCIRITRAA